jgi:hypothetical protein
MTLAAGRTEPAAGVRARRRPLVLLGVAALVTECLLIAGVLVPLRLDQHPPSLHVNLATALGADVRGLALYLLLVAGLFGAYCLALQAARSAHLLGRRPIAAALAGSALFGATLVPAHPTYSSDVFHYLATARVAFAHGQNPHVVPPEAIADDPLMPLSGWKWVPSPYGPAWTWLSALPFLASGGADNPTAAVIWFKILAVLSVLGSAAGVAVAAERLRPGSGAAAAIAFGWSPVVVLHFAADGHNDAAMLCLMAWGLAALAYERQTLATALIGGGVLVKLAAAPAALGLARWLAARRAWRRLVLGTLAALLAGALLIAPYWAGIDTFRAMADEGRYFTNTLAALLIRTLTPRLGEGTAQLLVGGLLRTALVVTLVWLTARARPAAEGLAGALAIAYVLAVTVLGGWYQPWYISWPLLFLAALVFRPVAVATALGLTAGALLVPAAVNFLAVLSGAGVHAVWVEALSTTLALAPVLSALVIVRFRGPTAAPPISSQP